MVPAGLAAWLCSAMHNIVPRSHGRAASLRACRCKGARECGHTTPGPGALGVSRIPSARDRTQASAQTRTHAPAAKAVAQGGYPTPDSAVGPHASHVCVWVPTRQEKPGPWRGRGRRKEQHHPGRDAGCEGVSYARPTPGTGQFRRHIEMSLSTRTQSEQWWYNGQAPQNNRTIIRAKKKRRHAAELTW